MSLSAIAIAIPTTNAHDPPWSIPTYAYIVASPNTVAVNEYTLLVMWLNCIPPTAGGSGGDRWRGFMIDVTAPDGTQSQLGPFESGSVGTTYTTFTPTQVGEYTLVFHWPGQTLGAPAGSNPMGMSYVGDFFEPATSAPMILTVTQEPVAEWQEPEPTTGYWTRPLNAQNRGWTQLASNWLGGSWLVSNVQTAGQAPNSAHIVWTQPIAEQPGVAAGHPGGLADAQWTGIPYNTDDYQRPWTSPIIMNGIIYYNTPADAMTARYGYYAMDLRTGEQLWYNNGTFNNPVTSNPSFGEGPALGTSYPSLSFGQIQHYYSLNGEGMIAYLWMTQGNTWYMLNPDNGNLIMTLKNVPGGIGITDQDGNILRYSYNPSTGNILAWNSSQALPFGAPGTGTSANQWRPRVGAVVDAVNDTTWMTYPLPGDGTNGAWTYQDTLHTGYSMNVTIEPGLVWRNAASYSMNFGTTKVLQDAQRVPRMIFSWNNPTAQGDVTGGAGTFRAWAANIDYGVTTYNGGPQNNSNLGYGATLLWNKEYQGPLAGNLTWIYGPVSYEDNVWTIYSKETMQWFGYSLTTGEMLWGPTDPQGAWDMYGMGGTIAYGNMYSCGYGGVLYCYNIADGNLKWDYEAPSVGHESPYGNYPLSIGTIADGKVYLYSTEHSPTKPLWRGSYLRCVDAYSGNEAWKIETWADGIAVADGYLVCANHYNNNIQCFGKGQTAVTVSAPDITVAKNTAVLIKGTITDQSPGAPNTPAIADQFMQKWMEYLHEQQAMPDNAQGVPVKLTAIDEAGNTQTIGTVTSDMSGIFKTMWTPQNEGAYTIVATFEGTNSYYASSGQTVVGVGSASNEPSGSPDAAVLPMEVLIAVAVLIVAALAAVIVVARRKK
ncbi:MAG: hypothetical protein NWF04_00790 [Candidatus Bathyarchaeota archaeon]|nr:hypothetical protein [Candidatus Bathyarchaeota archaeon]